MRQKVNHMSYLAQVAVDLAELENGEKKGVMLPKGSSVIGVFLEVEESRGSGNVDVYLEKSGVEFFKDVELRHDNLRQKYYSSSVHTTAKQDDIVSLRLVSGSFESGSALLKVHYFLPSQIMTEI